MFDNLFGYAERGRSNRSFSMSVFLFALFFLVYRLTNSCLCSFLSIAVLRYVVLPGFAFFDWPSKAFVSGAKWVPFLGRGKRPAFGNLKRWEHEPASRHYSIALALPFLVLSAEDALTAYGPRTPTCCNKIIWVPLFLKRFFCQGTKSKTLAPNPSSNNTCSR